MIFEQTSFGGGMNLLLPDTQVPADSYVQLINGRQRLGFIEPNYKHRLVDAPIGKKQGIVSIGKVLLLFVAGKAYYQKDGNVGWVQVPNFLMDTLVSRYYTQAVPASIMNFVRKSTAEGFGAPVVISSDFSVSGTPSALVVQDTINQPWLIFFDPVNEILTARVSKNYSQWSNVSVTADDREYIPVGRQMMFINQSLYVVSRDNKSVYRSVTGRPMDFVIAVDRNGNKLANELQGGATALSFAFDFDNITCLQSVNVPDSFVYATAKTVRIVTLDYTFRLFNEPTFSQSAIIDAGAVNQDSFVEILGDYAFTDNDGIKSFNAVQQLNVEGRNSIFSLQLTAILKNIKQRSPSCVSFNNFALFYVKTTLGNLIAVYDTLRQSWVSLDLTEVDQIKQFCVLETTIESKLYCITDRDELFQLYDKTQTRECAYLFTRAIANENFSIQHKSQIVRPVFKSGTFDGTCGIVEYVDGLLGIRLNSNLLSSSCGIAYPVIPPIIPSTLPQTDNDAWLLKDGLGGHKINYVIYWDNDAQLKGYFVETSDINKDTSLVQSDKAYAQ